MSDTNKTLSDFAKNALKLKLPEGEELRLLQEMWAKHREIDTLRAKEDFEIDAKRTEEYKELNEKLIKKLKDKTVKEDIEIQKLRDEEDRELGRHTFSHDMKPMSTGHPITPEIYREIISKNYNNK